MFGDATGEWLLVWTIRLSVVCYLFCIAIGLRDGLIERIPSKLSCAVWAAGCILYVLHVVCAFEYTHSWSHAAAVEHTAIETDRIIGVRRGDGVWVNYVFTLIWIADVIRLTYANYRSSKTNRRIDWFVQAVFAFIVINATVVFGPNLYRWAVVPVLVTLLWIRYDTKKLRPSNRRPQS